MSFTLPYRGAPPIDGNLDSPASAMPRGIGVVRSGTTVAKAASTDVPYGFLNSEVTIDGPLYEELIHIPESVIHEKKVSEGKVQVILYQPGNVYITKDNVKAGTTFAVGEQIFPAANGEFTDLAGASPGDVVIGVVEEIDLTHAGETGCVAWQAVSNLGSKV